MTSILFEKQAQTQMSCISNQILHLTEPYGERVLAWYGLVDVRTCTQGCSPWPTPTFNSTRMTYFQNTPTTRLLDGRAGLSDSSVFRTEQYQSDSVVHVSLLSTHAFLVHLSYFFLICFLPAGFLCSFQHVLFLMNYS